MNSRKIGNKYVFEKTFIPIRGPSATYTHEKIKTQLALNVQTSQQAHLNRDFLRKETFARIRIGTQDLPTCAFLPRHYLPYMNLHLYGALLVSSILGELAEVTKTTTSVTSNIAHPIARCETASHTALSYQDHLATNM